MIWKLKYLLFLFLPFCSFGQHCDTLYSHQKYVECEVEVGYRNCHLVDIDTVYRIVQWLNVDTNHLQPFFSKNICQKLYNSTTGKLIHERWQVGDTICNKTYYNSGQLKSFSKNVYIETPYYFHFQLTRYYENGSIRYKGDYKSLSFSTHTTYYPNGVVETRAKKFSLGTSPCGEYFEYFPNGQVSMIQTFSEPDTTTDNFQLVPLISEVYFDETGQESDQNLNEYKTLYLPIKPPIPNTTLMIGDDLYTSQQFEDQAAYTNGMSELKNRIINDLDISDLNCTKGIPWISLIITRKGVIEQVEVKSKNDSLNKRIEASIKRIKNWPAAIKDGTTVDTYVYTYLIIDK